VNRKLFEISNFKSEMREVVPHRHRARSWERTDLDELLALRGLKKDKLRTARGTVTGHFCKAEDLRIKAHCLREILNAIAGVK
jgi:hypothetical protein